MGPSYEQSFSVGIGVCVQFQVSHVGDEGNAYMEEGRIEKNATRNSWLAIASDLEIWIFKGQQCPAPDVNPHPNH